MPELPTISEAEWEVMEVVWARAKVSAQEVHAALASHRSWTEGTVKTLLRRLLQKGAVRYELEGKRYLYSARLTRERVVRAEADSFLQRVFRGSASPMLAHFVKSTKLSPDEIKELRRLLQEKQSEEGGR
ncbi:MAG: BlaI/MecI/CopY family transcriptional regulator [Planctomycetes bacterium]|nr:BlaI/MecI/CopY family transcriptional regulator [Planctomycetota bacterium]